MSPVVHGVCQTKQVSLQSDRTKTCSCSPHAGRFVSSNWRFAGKRRSVRLRPSVRWFVGRLDQTKILACARCLRHLAHSRKQLRGHPIRQECSAR